MSREEMQYIAGLMTTQGIPINVNRYREGWAKALDRISHGDPVRLRQTEAKLADLITGFDGHLSPTWSVVARGPRVVTDPEIRPLEWTSANPNAMQIPGEMLKAVEGVYIYHDQPDLYFLALLAGNPEWCQHYEQGGSLWDKVQESVGDIGPCSFGTKERFYRSSMGATTVRDSSWYWLGQAVSTYAHQPENDLRTAQGTLVPAPDQRSRTLYYLSTWSAKEGVVKGVLDGFRQSGVAPFLVHHDGVIVPEGAVQTYANALSRDGLRVIIEGHRSGEKITSRRPEVVPQPQPRLSRFDIIDAF